MIIKKIPVSKLTHQVRRDHTINQRKKIKKMTGWEVGENLIKRLTNKWEVIKSVSNTLLTMVQLKLLNNRKRD